MAEQKYKIRAGSASTVNQNALSGKSASLLEGNLAPAVVSPKAKTPQPDLLDKPLSEGVERHNDVNQSSADMLNNGAKKSAISSESERTVATAALEEARLQQARRLRLLKECEGVLLVNDEWLDMPDYPSNDLLAIARRQREYFIVVNVILGICCILALIEWVPAWVGGSSLGLLFVSLCISFTPLRHYLFRQPSFAEIIALRKKFEFQALGHIRLLEGKSGFAWKLENLAPYNSALKRELFRSVITYSRANKLLSVIKRREHIRLYLLFLLEAEKAYQRLKKEYLATHRDLLLRGVDDSV
jgi:hypothetical protein